jgi:hypothetical protein
LAITQPPQVGVEKFRMEISADARPKNRNWTGVL